MPEFFLGISLVLAVGVALLALYQHRTGQVLFNLNNTNLAGGVLAGGAGGYDLYATPAQSLTINLQTGMLFEGAQLMIDALGGPYMLIAGFALGVAILGAVFSAIRAVRF